ncbi:MAG: thiosulfate oxidation carrier protein SoxY [Halobacteria archaeon]|nr:thiosulfate oxidation carrier protein SoxY [Halobacteria archaeon]
MLSRRDLLLLFSAVAATSMPFGWLVREAGAAPRDAKELLVKLTGGAEQQKGGVTITLPAVTDQARHVPMRISVASPMTENDHVKSIHVVAERNPTPAIASFQMGPANGKAEISTRIRLIKTQIVIAAAEMSDGSVRIGKARCKITGGAGACG